MKEFSEYTNLLVHAFAQHNRKQEILAKKKEIIDTICELHNFVPSNILFIGFTPLALAVENKNITVCGASSEAVALMSGMGKNVTVIEANELPKYSKHFDCVIAMDENFTYASSEESQRDWVTQICDLTTDLVITTLRDYKNQEYKDREFSQPAAIRQGNNVTAYLEFHNMDFRNREKWYTTVFELGQELNSHGPFARRTMFFKQMAKYSKDAGAVDFLVHKNLMYKSLIKKNYEHVISIKFE